MRHSPCPLYASIGIASLFEDVAAAGEKVIDALLNHADAAMYLDKHPH